MYLRQVESQVMIIIHLLYTESDLVLVVYSLQPQILILSENNWFKVSKHIVP